MWKAVTVVLLKYTLSLTEISRRELSNLFDLPFLAVRDDAD